MGHRQLFHAVPLSEMDDDQLRSYSHPQQPTRTENGSFVVPSESMPTNGMNPATSTVPTRSIEFTPWVSNSYLSPHLAPSMSLVPPGLQLAPGSSNQVPVHYPQHELPHYSRDEAGPSSSHSHSEREHLRRKRPAVSTSQVSNGYIMGGSSHIQNPEYLHNKTMPGSQIQPWETMIPDYRGSRLLLPGEGSRRNVRRRHNVQLEPNMPGSQVPSSLPGYASYPTADLPGPTMSGQWNRNVIPMAPPHGVIASPVLAPGRFNVDINQPIFGNPTVNGGYVNNVPPPGYVAVPFPVHHIPGRAIAGSQNSSAQRPYRQPPSYLAFDNAASSSEAVPRHSRSLFIGDPRGTERSGRTRYSRFQSLPAEFTGHGRWIPDALVAIDRSVYYDSRNLFDQHHDMRLDIDNMSYEELLALEERIGNVNTGLTEDSVSKYMKETIYCSPDKVEVAEEEDNCTICLESYNDGDKLGMLKCGHDYHMTCIKKWLLIKNACPICKSPAVEN